MKFYYQIGSENKNDKYENINYIVLLIILCGLFS